MKPELIIFDMAGTTVYDADGAVARCLCDTLEAAGYPVSMPAAIALMGIPKPVAIRQLLTEQNVTAGDSQIATLHQDFVSRMLEYYRHSPEVVAITGAEDTFAALRCAGIKIALDTGFSRDIADAIIERLGWQDKIDASITSDEVENGRPHPDMIFALMSHFGISDPARVAKVGDTPSDLREGHAARCGWVIGVTEGTHTAAQLTSCPHTHLIPTVAVLPVLWNIE